MKPTFRVNETLFSTLDKSIRTQKKKNLKKIWKNKNYIQLQKEKERITQYKSSILIFKDDVKESYTQLQKWKGKSYTITKWNRNSGSKVLLGV